MKTTKMRYNNNKSNMTIMTAVVAATITTFSKLSANVNELAQNIQKSHTLTHTHEHTLTHAL